MSSHFNYNHFIGNIDTKDYENLGSYQIIDSVISEKELCHGQRDIIDIPATYDMLSSCYFSIELTNDVDYVDDIDLAFFTRIETLVGGLICDGISNHGLYIYNTGYKNIVKRNNNKFTLEIPLFTNVLNENILVNAYPIKLVSGDMKIMYATERIEKLIKHNNVDSLKDGKILSCRCTFHAKYIKFDDPEAISRLKNTRGFCMSTISNSYYPFLSLYDELSLIHTKHIAVLYPTDTKYFNYKKIIKKTECSDGVYTVASNDNHDFYTMQFKQCKNTDCYGHILLEYHDDEYNKDRNKIKNECTIVVTNMFYNVYTLSQSGISLVHLR